MCKFLSLHLQLLLCCMYSKLGASIPLLCATRCLKWASMSYSGENADERKYHHCSLGGIYDNKGDDQIVAKTKRLHGDKSSNFSMFVSDFIQQDSDLWWPPIYMWI